MNTDIKCETCGRWITESEDSFIQNGKSCCKACKSKPIFVKALGKMIQRGVTRVLSLLV